MGSVTVLAGIDWMIIAVVLLVSMLIGYFLKDKAEEDGIEGFFVAGRDMKWWFLGTSMVATTFSADTPLVITGWIAKYGIAGNWFWWGIVIGYMAMTVFFARKWRVSGVVTDTEITEMRYGGKPAIALRTTKAFVNAVIINPLILGWVFAAMSKFSEPFMDWAFLLGPTIYQYLTDYYPSFLIFGTIDNSLTIWILLSLTVFYSTLGGVRAVIVTDLFQFVLAMSMSILLAWMAVAHIGGLESTWNQLAELYPSDGSSMSLSGEPFLPHDNVASFIPSFGDGVIGSLGLPFSAFIMTLGIMWWANSSVDGSGYIAQRLYTAKDGGEAEKGALWFVVANFLLRSWPWAIAGVAALVIYPRVDVDLAAHQFTACLQDQSVCSVEMNECLNNRYACKIKEYALLYRTEVSISPMSLGVELSGDNIQPEIIEVFKEDRERSYPALIKDILPAGLMGLAVAALIAAIMSTVSTHINWGASYVTNDFYLRFINPQSSDRKITLVSRLSTITITVYSAFIATFIDNLGDIWILYAGMIAGMGLPNLLRWLWWRANAWTEIVGMLTSVLLAVANFFMGQHGGYPDGQISIFPYVMSSHDFHTISWIALLSCVASLIATFLTEPVDDRLLKQFVKIIRPIGFWKGHNGDFSSERSFKESVFYWLLGTTSIYAGMFGTGYLIRLEYLTGIFLLMFCAISMVIMIKGMNQVDSL